MPKVIKESYFRALLINIDKFFDRFFELLRSIGILVALKNTHCCYSEKRYIPVVHKNLERELLWLLQRIFIRLSPDSVRREILNDPRTFYCNDCFVIRRIFTCLCEFWLAFIRRINGILNDCRNPNYKFPVMVEKITRRKKTLRGALSKAIIVPQTLSSLVFLFYIKIDLPGCYCMCPAYHPNYFEIMVNLKSIQSSSF